MLDSHELVEMILGRVLWPNCRTINVFFSIIIMNGHRVVRIRPVEQMKLIEIGVSLVENG